MYHFKNSAQLKAIARGQLLGQYGVFVPAVIFYQIISYLAVQIISIFIQTNTFSGIFLFILANLVLQIIYGYFTIGFSRMYMMLSCKRGCKFSDLFFGFSNYQSKTLLLTLRLYCILIACMLPGSLIFSCALVFGNSYMILLGSIFLLASLLATGYYSLRYHLVYYLALDFPNYTIKQLFSCSAFLMKGQFFRLLYLYVSFIPLYLLSLLSFGITNFWILPYQQATICNFYLNTVKTKSCIVS